MTDGGSPFLSPAGGRGVRHIVVVQPGMLHIIGVPLLILASIGVAFVIVYLKEVLLPFVISFLLVYLLRPIVTLLTTPFGKMFPCCHCKSQVHSRARFSGGYARVATNASGNGRSGAGLGSSLSGSGSDIAGDALEERGHLYSRGGAAVAAGGPVRRGSSRGASPPKYPRTLRGVVTRALSTAAEVVAGRRSAAPTAAAAGAGVNAGAGSGSVSPGAGGSGTANAATGVAVSGGTSASGAGAGTSASATAGQLGGAGATSGAPASVVVAGVGGAVSGPGAVHLHHHHRVHEEECGCCWGSCRMTRCPRWFAILVALLVSASVLSGLVLLVADAVQRFQADSLHLYLTQASNFTDELQRWFSMFGIHLDAQAILDVVRQHVSVVNVVQTTITVILDGVGNALLITLLVLYLLAEQAKHPAGSLRAKVDEQIQSYVVIKTAMSAAQGVVVFIVLQYVLNVRMAHMFGVLHFLLNYIPTAGPALATVVPLPIVVLDPDLSVAAKIAAFAAPTAVHMIVGNLLEPMVFGSSMELHPVTVLLFLAIWYALWGIPGAILAVPITAVMRIILSAMDHPYAQIVIAIMEGRLSAATAEIDSALDANGEPLSGMSPAGLPAAAASTPAAATSVHFPAAGGHGEAGLDLEAGGSLHPHGGSFGGGSAGAAVPDRQRRRFRGHSSDDSGVEAALSEVSRAGNSSAGVLIAKVGRRSVTSSNGGSSSGGSSGGGGGESGRGRVFPSPHRGGSSSGVAGPYSRSASFRGQGEESSPGTAGEEGGVAAGPREGIALAPSSAFGSDEEDGGATARGPGGLRPLGGSSTLDFLGGGGEDGGEAGGAHDDRAALLGNGRAGAPPRWTTTASSARTTPSVTPTLIPPPDFSGGGGALRSGSGGGSGGAPASSFGTFDGDGWGSGVGHDDDEDAHRFDQRALALPGSASAGSSSNVSSSGYGWGAEAGPRSPAKGRPTSTAGADPFGASSSGRGDIF